MSSDGYSSSPSALEQVVAIHPVMAAERECLVNSQVKSTEFIQSSESIIDADSNYENEMHNADSDPTSSQVRDIMKSMRNYLDAHSNDELNNKMDDMEQFTDNLMKKKTIQRKI
ncbi:hypothetical protein TNCV_4872141 [Trichonephila clavipes]|nr:hypothetical protein TNCV_4872141 [Trichonephila clavipes]